MQEDAKSFRIEGTPQNELEDGLVYENIDSVEVVKSTTYRRTELYHVTHFYYGYGFWVRFLGRQFNTGENRRFIATIQDGTTELLGLYLTDTHFEFNIRGTAQNIDHLVDIEGLWHYFYFSQG